MDDCREKFFVKGHVGKCFYFGDVYLALGRGIVAVSEETKKPFGIKIKKCRPETYESVAKLIAKRLESAHTWLTTKKNYELHLFLGNTDSCQSCKIIQKVV